VRRARRETRLPLLQVLPGSFLILFLQRTQAAYLAHSMGQDARIKPAQLILLNGESQFGKIEREILPLISAIDAVAHSGRLLKSIKKRTNHK
jgi:hypothetical protein